MTFQIKVWIYTCLVLQVVLFTRPTSATTSQTASPSSPLSSSTKSSDRKSIIQQLRTVLKENVQICYDRYKKCTKLLSPYFCNSVTWSNAFFLWARRAGVKIMEGTKKGKSNRDHLKVRCSPRFTKMIVHGVLSRYVENP